MIECCNPVHVTAPLHLPIRPSIRLINNHLGNSSECKTLLVSFLSTPTRHHLLQSQREKHCWPSIFCLFVFHCSSLYWWSHLEFSLGKLSLLYSVCELELGFSCHLSPRWTCNRSLGPSGLVSKPVNLRNAPRLFPRMTGRELMILSEEYELLALLTTTQGQLIWAWTQQKENRAKSWGEGFWLEWSNP